MNQPQKHSVKNLERLIQSLDETDLIHLNRIIVERLNLFSQMKTSLQLSDFHNGQQVSFTTPEGELKKGVILRLNKKTVSILTEDNMRWNVHPEFLTKV